MGGDHWLLRCESCDHCLLAVKIDFQVSILSGLIGFPEAFTLFLRFSLDRKKIKQMDQRKKLRKSSLCFSGRHLLPRLSKKMVIIQADMEVSLETANQIID